MKKPSLSMPTNRGYVPFFLSMIIESPPIPMPPKTGFGPMFVHFHQKRYACFYVEQKVPLLYFLLKQGCVPFFLSIFFEPPPYFSRRKQVLARCLFIFTKKDMPVFMWNKMSLYSLFRRERHMRTKSFTFFNDFGWLHNARNPDLYFLRWMQKTPEGANRVVLRSAPSGVSLSAA